VYSRVIATSEVAHRVGVPRCHQAGWECPAWRGGSVVGWSARTPVGYGPSGPSGRSERGPEVRG
jgi:hypothetical protein